MPDSTAQKPTNSGSLNRYGIRGIVAQVILIIIGFVILFASAGTLNWINGWVYVGLILIMQVVSTIILAKLNPQLLNERGSVVKKGKKASIRSVWSSIPFWPLATWLSWGSMR